MKIILKRLRCIPWIRVLFLLWTVSFSPLQAEEKDHSSKSSTQGSQPARALVNSKTSEACWHAQLMQIHSDMINARESVSTYQPKRDGKEFIHNISASAEMRVGSRMEVFETQKACDIIIAFRGTYQHTLETDFTQNVNLIPSEKGADYHPGFVKIANSYKKNIEQVLREARKKCGKEEIKVTLTGHSMGGSVAYAVANILENINLGSPELVLFGAPRVLTRPSKRVERVKAVHYFIDQDPVVVSVPGIGFKELTNEMYRFEKIPVTQEVSIPGQGLIQNHLPSNYKEKMNRWCEGLEKPMATSKITHTLLDAGSDAATRAGRAIIDAVGDRVLPGISSTGEKLPGLTETVGIIRNYSDNSKPATGAYWNSGDGKSFAVNLACSKRPIIGSKTEAGRNYFCNKTKGFNSIAQEACFNRCQSTVLIQPPTACTQGCYDHMHQFCIGNSSCF
ncbi:MAG: lipase family protein [Bdellovibrionales bacterium]|nr:lipase family protein [Bdellovibrionales bacterium]